MHEGRIEEMAFEIQERANNFSRTEKGGPLLPCAVSAERRDDPQLKVKDGVPGG